MSRKDLKTNLHKLSRRVVYNVFPRIGSLSKDVDVVKSYKLGGLILLDVSGYPSLNMENVFKKIFHQERSGSFSKFRQCGVFYAERYSRPAKNRLERNNKTDIRLVEPVLINEKGEVVQTLKGVSLEETKDKSIFTVRESKGDLYFVLNGEVFHKRSSKQEVSSVGGDVIVHPVRKVYPKPQIAAEKFGFMVCASEGIANLVRSKEDFDLKKEKEKFVLSLGAQKKKLSLEQILKTTHV